MIGPYYVGQVPADPLVLTVSKDDGSPRDLSSYTSVSLLLTDGAGASVNTSGGSTVRDANVGEVLYHWPTTSLFLTTGTYRYQLSLDGPGAVHDLTGVGTFDVLAVGSIEILPSVGEFAAFWGDEAPVEDTGWDDTAAQVLQQSSDLLFMVTTLEDMPTDARQARLVQYAIMDLAIMLYVSDSAEAYSPYSSERIGSYSYTLRVKAAEGNTGVFWWDLVVGAIRDGEWNDAYSLVVSGERVFHQGFHRFWRGERLLHVDPFTGPPGTFDVALIDPARGADFWNDFGGWAGDSPY